MDMRKFLIIITALVMSLILTACNDDGEVIAPTFVSVRVDNIEPVTGGEFYTYYRGKGDTVTVEVALTNPSNLKIKSVVINGYTHFSTKFDPTSTNTLITFDLDVGTTLEETIYSVDRINYLDGENNQYVTITNNNEFRVYVYKDLPSISRENFSTTIESISVDFNIEDEDSVILPDTLIAYLYSGETLIDSESIESGLITVTFTGLLAHRDYEIKIIGSYDLDDGNDVQSNIPLYSETYSTLRKGLPSASIENVETSSNSVTFDVNFNDEDNVVTPGGLVVGIYNDDILVDSINLTGTTTELTFEDLLNDKSYDIEVRADYDLNDGIGVQEDNTLAIHTFSTLPRQVPTPAILNMDLQENSIEFDVFINDPFDVIDETTLYAEIYIEGEYVDTAVIEQYHVDFQVSNLFSNKDFTIKILGDYDLNNGLGIQEDQVLLSNTYNTLENAIPSINIVGILVEQGYVTIDLQVLDANETLMGSIEAFLYEGDTVVQTVEFDKTATQIIFDYPTTSETNYYIEFVADYNLRDETGAKFDQVLRRIVSYTAEDKAPIAEIHNVVATTSTIDFDVVIIDADGTSIPGETYAYLYLGSTEITSVLVSEGHNSIEVDGLLSNNQYTIEVIGDYNLDDGSGVLEDMMLIALDVMTLSKDLPTYDLLDSEQDQNSITIDVDIIDDFGVVEPGSIIAELLYEGTSIATQPLVIGENFNIEFVGLLSDNNYTIRLYADYDLNDGNGVISNYMIDEITIKTDRNDEPSASIISQQANQETITLGIEVYDVHSVITGNLRAILLEVDSGTGDLIPTGDEITLNVGINNNVTFDTVYAETRYYINIVADYDLNDGEAAVTDALLEQISLTTTGYNRVFGSISNVIVTSNSITFDTFVNDDSSIITGNLQAVLYKDDVATGDVVPVVLGAQEGVAFLGVDSATDYTIKLEADYDLNLETSPELAVVLDEVDVRTDDLAAPTVGFGNLITDYTSFIVDIEVRDNDGTITDNLIAELYEDGLKIAEQPLTVGQNLAVAFDTLYSDYDYTVRVFADYNRNDELGEQLHQEIGTFELHTDTKPLPEYVLSNLSLTKTEITFNITFDDVEDVMIDGTLYVGLYVGDSLIDEIQYDSDTVSFDIANFIADFDFEIRFTGDYNLGDNQGDVLDGTIASLTFTTLTNAVPEASITGAVATQTTVEATVNVTDVDNTIVAGLEARLIDNTGAEVAPAIPLVVGSNAISFDFTTMYQELYRVVIVADYNLRDATATQDDAILAETVVSIYNKLIPEAIISDINLDQTSITFDAMVYDNDATIIAASTFVQLYLDGTYIDQLPLDINLLNDDLSFPGLRSNRDYELRVITDYDSSDGVGTYANQTLVSTVVTTNAQAAPTTSVLEDSITEDSIIVDVVITDTDAVSSERRVVLYDQFGTVVETILVSIGTNDNVTFNTGLYANESYTVKVFIDYDLNTGLSTVINEELASSTFTTDALEAPSASFNIDGFDADSIDFTVIVEDDYSVTNNLKAVLYLNGSEVDSIPLNVGEQSETFSGLASSSEYLIQIETDYDLQERSGEVFGEVIVFTYQTTRAVLIPVVNIGSIATDFDAFDVGITVVDDDGAITGNLKAVLYKDGIATVQEEVLVVGENTVTFDTLLANNEYEVKVFADYDLEDGAGEQTDVEFDSQLVTTAAKETPSIQTSNVSITYDQVSFDVRVLDNNGVYTNNTLIASLYDGVTLIASQELLTDQVLFDLSGFIADYPFEIRITGDYNLDDGNGLIDDGVLASIELRTLAYDAPSISIGDITPHQNSVDTTIVVTDNDDTSVVATIIATLYDETETPMDSVVLSVGSNDVSFSHTVTQDQFYSIVVTADYDLLDGTGVQDDAILGEAVLISYNLLAPEAVIENIVVDETSITFDATIYDNNSVTTGNLYAQLYLDGVYEAQTIINVGANPGENFTGLLSGTEYEIRIVTDYNNGDGNGVYSSVMAISETATTDSYAVPTASFDLDTLNNDTIIVDVTVTDFDSVTTSRDAVLYNEAGVEVDRIGLNIGFNSNVEFTGLFTNETYILQVEVDYDLNDGEPISEDVGILTETIVDRTFQTSSLNVPTSTIVTETAASTTITLELESVDTHSTLDGSIEAVLYQNNIEVTRQNVALGTTIITFTGLDSDTEYYIEIIGDYDLGEVSGAITDEILDFSYVVTLEKVVPQITLNSTTVSEDEVVIEYTIDDVDGVMTPGTVKALLVVNDSVVATQAVSINTISFDLSGFLANFPFEIRFTADYDLDDGAGLQDDGLIATFSLSTLAYEVPSAAISGTTVLPTTLDMTVEITDDDNTTIGNIEAILYDSSGAVLDTVVLNVGTNNISFDYIIIEQTSYRVEIQADYNQLDGVGDLTDQVLAEQVVYIQDKPEVAPTATIDAITPANTTLDVDITVIDNDNVNTNLSAVLYLNSVEVDSIALVIGVNNIQFSTLLAGTEYEIKVFADYELDDGNGPVADVELVSQTQSTDVLVTIDNITNDLVSNKGHHLVDITIDDASSILTTSIMTATLYEGLTTKATYIITSDTTTTIEMTNLLTNYDYRLVISASYDVGAGTETEAVYEYEFTTDVPATPSAVINSLTEGDTTIDFDIDVTDDDTVITGNLQAVLYKDGIATGDTIALIVGNNTDQFSGLLSGVEYEVRVETDYNLLDGNGVQAAEMLATDTSTTTAQVAPTVSIENFVNWENVADNLEVDITIGSDTDTVATDTSWTAYLYVNGVYVDEVDMYVSNANSNPEGGTRTITFSNYTIIGGESYTIIVTASIDLNDGDGASETALDSASGIDAGN